MKTWNLDSYNLNKHLQLVHLFLDSEVTPRTLNTVVVWCATAVTNRSNFVSTNQLTRQISFKYSAQLRFAKHQPMVSWLRPPIEIYWLSTFANQVISQFVSATKVQLSNPGQFVRSSIVCRGTRVSSDSESSARWRRKGDEGRQRNVPTRRQL